MSSGLADSSVDFIPTMRPSECSVVHAKRAYVSDGALAGTRQRARSGNELWLVEMVWDEIYRDDAIEMIADLERWGTVESFRIYIPGEEDNLGDATTTQLDGLEVTDATGTSTATDVQFTNNASTPDTITYAAGPAGWVADGFKPGMALTISGADDATNDGTANRFIATVTATTITLSADSPDLATDASDTGVTITGAFTHQGRQLGVKTDPTVASTTLLSKGCLIGWTVNGKNEMARLYADLTTDSAGEATANLAQYIRDAPAAGTKIYTRHIPLRVCLLEDPGYQLTSPVLYSFRLRFQEIPAAT